MTTSVVIPNWNGEKLLKKNLPSVLKIGADEVIVIDDASTDDSLGYLKTLKGVVILANERNVGFARSINRGVHAASGDIIILLNTDVKPSPGLLKGVMPYFDDPKIFGVSFSEERHSWARGIWRNGYVEHEPGQLSTKAHITFWISGGSGAFRKKTWDELGGLDEVFIPFYWEDMDISYRAAKRGYVLLWEPKARVVHGHEGTIGKYFSRDYINFVQERNQLLFIWKNITSSQMTKQHLAGLFGRLLNSPGYIKVILSAVLKWPYIAKARRREEREARVSDERIFENFSQLST